MKSLRAFSPIAPAFAIAALIFGITAHRMFSSGLSEAPEVRFATTRGELLSTSDLRGKVILINFWATSCAPCLKEMPQLAATHVKYAAQGFETVAVAMDYDPPGLVRDFALRHALPFRVAFDTRGEIAKRFGDVRVVPTSFLIDRHGRVILTRAGELDFGTLHPLLEKALKESPA
jgi:peroxiredoxin